MSKLFAAIFVGVGVWLCLAGHALAQNAGNPGNGANNGNNQNNFNPLAPRNDPFGYRFFPGGTPLYGQQFLPYSPYNNYYFSQNQWFQRPYPYHLDYYRYRFGTNHAPDGPYDGDLNGIPDGQGYANRNFGPGQRSVAGGAGIAGTGSATGAAGGPAAGAPPSGDYSAAPYGQNPSGGIPTDPASYPTTPGSGLVGRPYGGGGSYGAGGAYGTGAIPRTPQQTYRGAYYW